MHCGRYSLEWEKPTASAPSRISVAEKIDSRIVRTDTGNTRFLGRLLLNSPPAYSRKGTDWGL